MLIRKCDFCGSIDNVQKEIVILNDEPLKDVCKSCIIKIKNYLSILKNNPEKA